MQRGDATLTVDTGAYNMIVSHWLFERMSEDQRPQLLKNHPRGGAGRGPLKSYGKVVMEIWMGPFCFDHMYVVSDIVDEVLLWEGLLLCDSSSPSDIIQSKIK